LKTLYDWGIELAAVPKGVMPTDSPYVSDESVQDIGNHREPNLEIIAAVDPELVIIGQRFASYTDDIKAIYNGSDTVMSVIVSGGNIGFSAPHSGRVWGPMYDIFGWIPALEIDNSSSDHQGDDVSVEAIAQSNPDWILVLDRDASVSSTNDAVPAQDVIDNSPALQNIAAVVEKKIIYAPNDTYTNESIQTYLELFSDLANALAK
jgi:iron complex transport system substrate-binding protein